MLNYDIEIGAINLVAICSGGSRIFEGGVAGVEYGRALKAPVAECHRCKVLGVSGKF